ncbi:hypothetical protein [Nocardia sp.]|uniref:hypothetical protein n=1 Tax=Nocardia sp. TaxID=1821 RepID=UPI002612D621|nr:hypothetical protein [Nocardia sp.]
MTALNNEQNLRTRGPWFGRASFISAAVGGFLNVTSLFTLGFAYFFLALFFLIELIVIAALCLAGGRSRQIGTGLAITFLSALTLIVLMLCLTWVRENLLR